ncbi:hypothetical protein CCB80_06725 [Armatimonadetes bacterium Uphvl-Ar1]|nr:hypothetical protein CCB80_06725 [Armatimonadetes bacterium Uphvl-Ar1]
MMLSIPRTISKTRRVKNATRVSGWVSHSMCNKDTRRDGHGVSMRFNCHSMNFFKSAMRVPVLRNHEENPERHASWLELFFDLAFVAVLGRVSVELAKSHDFETLIRFGLIFVPIWWAWIGQVFYLSRFDTDDLSHRLSSFFQIIVLGFMATSIPKAFAGDVTGFVVCYGLLRGVLVFEYWFAGRHIPEARPLTMIYSRGFLLAIGLWLLSLAVPSPFRYGLWILGMLVDFWTPNFCREMGVKYPPHPMHTPERFGLFTIIVLGEAVIATVGTLTGMVWTLPAAVAAVMGLMLACTIWWVYFDGVGAAEHRVPKSSDDVSRYRSWLYGHLPLHGGIVLVALGVERVVAHPMDILKGFEAYILPVAVATVALMMHVFYNSTVTKDVRLSNRDFTMPHNVVTCFMILLIPIAGFVPSIWILVGALIGMGGHTLLNIRGYPEEANAIAHRH